MSQALLAALILAFLLLSFSSLNFAYKRVVRAEAHDRHFLRSSCDSQFFAFSLNFWIRASDSILYVLKSLGFRPRF